MNITAYPLSDQAVTIEPAPSAPAATTAADLTRSLAWIFRCPYAVEITWNGGPAPEDITIRIDAPPDETPPFVHSHLGAGLVSFYPGYQIQTEVTHNLWVRGPINQPKDGLHPLEQIVDTSLLPCTITINWKFTCPRQTIRFAAGEPFGTILPYSKHDSEPFAVHVVRVGEALEAYEQAFQQLSQASSVQDVLRRLQGVGEPAAAQLTDRPNVGVVGPGHEPTMQPHLRVIRRGPDSDLAIRVRAALDIAYAGTINPEHGFYAIAGMSGKRYRLFINTLVSSIKDARYLEVGVWMGSTLCSAIYNNEIRAVAIDNWSEYGGPREHFLANLAKFGTPQAKVEFIEADFRSVDYSSIGTFNLFFFDGPHTYQDQYDGIVLIEKALDETFILIVDDWNWQEVREGTLQAIRHLGFNTSFSIEIRTSLDGSHSKVHGKHSDWHNGCFVAVLKR